MVAEYLLEPAVEDEILLHSTPTFERKLGVTDDDGSGTGDFDNAKYAWSTWNEGEMQDDEEKMKSAERRYLSHVGDWGPKRFCCGPWQNQDDSEGASWVWSPDIRIRAAHIRCAVCAGVP